MPARLAPVGAHVSVAGGLLHSLPRAATVGAEAMQVFVANPRGWAPPAADPAGDEVFRGSCPLPVFVHSPYLINFGSPSPETLAKSSQALAFSLRRGAAIGAAGVVLHAGSAVLGNAWDAAMAQLREHLLPLLDSVPEMPTLLIEPTAGGGGALASDAGSLAAYLDVLGRDERIGVCLDTCHMHAAGHDLSSVASFTAALRAYGKAAGRGRIGLVHVNDSRDPAGSKRDRHEAIGRGTIGADPFAALFSSPVTRRVPLVVETADDDHAADIAALKSLRAAAVGV
ncbi:deoxyribonuclease IV [Jatrophihabitans sp.]|uniref:deoxyribonuclease IV n=1 Tax=Jatrophihabitans sp. TaxID=1932789 RepID=UPI0030C70C96|nr:putative endonuclease 4 [Jatrophihabitans sp.]